MIGLIDYGMGNIRSVQKALERVGGETLIVTNPSELERTDKIVLPGVAAFGDAIAQLHAQGLVEPIVQAITDGTPYLGFCLGLQLLFDVSYEDGEHTGLGVIPGRVVRFSFPPSLTGQRLAVPHMGWNQLQISRPCPMLKGVASGDYVYFAHSYHVIPADDSVIATTTEYGDRFVSSVRWKNVFATQFHPEKSQDVGLTLLRNFVAL